MARIAEVFVNVPARRLANSFTYLVPDELAFIGPGWRVVVPFGSRKAEGFVVSAAEAGTADLAALTDQYDAVETRLSSLEEQAALLDGAETPLAELEKEIVVLKAAGLLNRSRLYMLQSNYGLAEEEVRLARGLLVDLQQQATSSEKGVLSAWIGRLDSALQALPDQPVMAGDDLEIAWQMLLRGLSAPLPTASATPTPVGPLVEDLQPTYTPWVTATLPAVPTATPTAVQ